MEMPNETHFRCFIKFIDTFRHSRMDSSFQLWVEISNFSNGNLPLFILPPSLICRFERKRRRKKKKEKEKKWGINPPCQFNKMVLLPSIDPLKYLFFVCPAQIWTLNFCSRDKRKEITLKNRMIIIIPNIFVNYSCMGMVFITQAGLIFFSCVPRFLLFLFFKDEYFAKKMKKIKREKKTEEKSIGLF